MPLYCLQPSTLIELLCTAFVADDWIVVKKKLAWSLMNVVDFRNPSCVEKALDTFVCFALLEKQQNYVF